MVDIASIKMDIFYDKEEAWGCDNEFYWEGYFDALRTNNLISEEEYQDLLAYLMKE